MMEGGMMGGGMLVGLIFSAILWVVPLYRLLPRAGLNRHLAWLAVIPILGFVLLWVVAFRGPDDAVYRSA